MSIFFLSLLILMISCENDRRENNSPDNKVTDEVKLTGSDTLDLIWTEYWVIYDKTVIIYENERYLVKTPLINFICDIYDFTGYDEYLNVKDSIASDGETQDILWASDYFPANKMDYLLAHFLEDGNCYIYDKEKGYSVKKVIIKWYTCAYPLAGAGGRTFYLNNEVFLDVIDFIC